MAERLRKGGKRPFHASVFLIDAHRKKITHGNLVQMSVRPPTHLLYIFFVPGYSKIHTCICTYFFGSDANNFTVFCVFTYSETPL